ncbi:MAG: gamma-glutamyltransferase [Kiritimatiellia bacterium]|jgi:gamma-glutamyltranspeptidase/glutathione hydrolase|nr:gamma-glutamyltransferase [Kiritimatiellia bacterium]
MNRFLNLTLFALLAACGQDSATKQATTASQQDTAPTSKPIQDGTVGDKGMVVGTTGAAAVQAGVEILKDGGNAMDAALATAMAQVTLAAGNWVSFAGIMTLVYYDAATDTVYNMNASYNTVSGEDDPMSIPGMNMEDVMSTVIHPSGRATLVPGFMKGVEAGHQRFGKAPWADLFAPSIKLAEDGIPFNAGLVQNLTFRENVISRRPETKAIFTREDGEFYQLDDNFKQLALADTLRKVAEDGNVDHLYKGAWAEKLVAAVQEEGGKMTIDDLASYEVIWSDPVVGDYAGHQVYSHGAPATGGANTIEALNILEASNIKELGHYTESPEALFWLTQITRLGMAGYLFPDMGEKFGLDMSLEGRLSKAQGEKLWAAIKNGELPFTSVPKTIAMHSDTIATVDQWGNMLGMVHSINTVSWGMTGIFVDGISIPDSAAHQQYQVAAAGPGNRLPDPTNPGLVMKDGKPLIAHGSIGMGLHQKTIQMLHSLLDFGMSPDDAANAPAFGAPEFTNTGLTPRTSISEGRFDADVVARANELGAGLFETDLMQGGWSAVMIEPESEKRLGGVSMVWALTPDNDSRPVGY